MAGEKLTLAELKQWYSAFNDIIQNYGGGTISTLATPDGGEVVPADINNLYDKITAMKNDEFLGTQPTFYDSFTKVASDTLVKRTDANPIINTATKIAAIKCRNTVTYTNQYNSHTNKGNVALSHGTNSHGENGWGTDSNGYDGNQNNAQGYCTQWGNGHWCNNGLCYWGQYGNGTYGNGALSHGAKSHGTNTHGQHTHGSKSNETYKDILNVHTTYNKNT